MIKGKTHNVQVQSYLIPLKDSTAGHCDRQVSWDNDMLSPLPNEVYCMQEPGRLREKGAGG